MLRILVLAILIPIAVVIAVAIFGAFFWSAG
jgi:cbb3-type cytochrome oxidase maturation protein